MDALYKRLEEMIRENKSLYQEIETVNNLNRDLKNKIKNMKEENNNLQKDIWKLTKENKIMGEKLVKNLKARKEDERFMKNEFNRKDILNKKLIGSSRDKKEILLKEELNNLYLRNNILLKVIKEISYDFEMFYKMVDIIKEVEEPLLDEMINNIKEMHKYKENDIK